MDIIKVSDKIYKKTPKYQGCESHIYEYDGLLLKVFNTDDLKILKNKRNKLEIIHDTNIDDIKPIDLAIINGVIKGYFIDNKEDYTILNIFKGNTKEKIEILNIIKNKLDILHKNNIIFGDIRPNNILVKGKDICFCDLDNTKISEFNFDLLCIQQQRYLGVLEADEYLDNYMFNLLVITYLKHILEPYTLDYIKKYKLPGSFNTEENKEIVKKMILLNDKTSIQPFVDHVKRYHLF